MDLSDTQIKILTKFITSAVGLRYSEAKPENVDNDLYKYHLKFLISKGYLEKKGDLYELTEDGKKYGLNISVFGEVQVPFKIAVMCVLITEIDGKKQILLQKRLRHPSFGETTVVCGKVKKGELINDAAARKFKEETGLDSEFKYIGLLRAIRFDKENKLFNDQWFNVVLANSFKGELIPNNIYWENYFFDLDKMNSLDNSRLTIRNLNQVLDKIRDNDVPFVIEDIATMDAY